MGSSHNAGYWVCPDCCTQFSWERDSKEIKNHNCKEKSVKKVTRGVGTTTDKMKKSLGVKPRRSIAALAALVDASVGASVGTLTNSLTPLIVYDRFQKPVATVNPDGSTSYDWDGISQLAGAFQPGGMNEVSVIMCRLLLPLRPERA